MGLFGFGKKKAASNNSGKDPKALVEAGLQLCKDFVRICDMSNPKERETANNFKQTMIPTLQEALGMPNIVPQGAIGILQVVCVSIIDALDGTTSEEQELKKDAQMLLYLIKDMPSSIEWV